MKNKIIFLIVSLMFLTVSTAKTNALTATPTPSDSDLQKKAQELLQKVASDTAKLNLTEKRGIIGTVTDASSTQITVEDVQGNTRFVDVDELTKFSNPAVKGSFGISDIQKGQTIGVLGLYNKSSRRILARFVDVMILPTFVHAAIAKIDSANFNFDVITDENKKLNIDVETVTKTFNYTLSDGMVKAGFSKIIDGENVVVIGYPDKKDANKIISSIVMLLPEIPKNPAINLPSTNSTGEVPTSTKKTVPSTGSGKTLTPLTR